MLTSPKPPEMAVTAPFAAWIKGEGKVEPVPLDKDVFGDGSVIMLYTPGHTPGHHSLLVKLPQKGAVILVGDLAHFHENYESNGVPTFNTDRAQSLASLDRVKKIAAAHQGDRHHPARRARPRQAAGVSGVGEVAARRRSLVRYPAAGRPAGWRWPARRRSPHASACRPPADPW